MAVMFVCGMGQAAAMDQQQQQEAMLQRAMALAEAATRAAIAAEGVAARSAQPPSSSGGERLNPLQSKLVCDMLKQHDLSDADCVRAIVAAHNEVEEKEMDSWEMTENGTPFYKCLGNSFVDPRPVWGMYWRCRTTLICVHQKNRNWLLVCLAHSSTWTGDGPLSPLIKMGGLESKILTVLGNVLLMHGKQKKKKNDLNGRNAKQRNGKN